jgi:hypothetical protein
MALVSSGGQPSIVFFPSLFKSGEYQPTPLVHEQYSLAAVFVKASMYCPAQLHSLSRFPNQINHLQVDFTVYSAKWSISIDGNPDCNLFIPCNIFLAVSFSCTY